MKKTGKFVLENLIKTPSEKLIRVRLDGKTVITISRLSQLEVWLKKYPDAKIIEE